MYRTEKRWIALTVVLAAAITATIAVAQNLTVRGVTTGEGDALFLRNVQVSGKLTASNTGSIAVHWGNGTAPPGTTLLYSGMALGGRYTHAGGGQTICVKPGDPGASSASINSTHADLLYSTATAEAARMPPGVGADSMLHCAVFRAPGETFDLWGSATCPGGTTALYTGYAMGNYYAHANPGPRHCVDNVNFDASIPRSGFLGDLVYGAEIHDPTGLTGYDASTWLQCAVCMLE